MFPRIIALVLALWVILPGCPLAQEEAPRTLLRDDAAGYILPLPAGWREVTETRALEELARRVCPVFIQDGVIPGATFMRGALLPDGGEASPALVAFALDYKVLGLGKTAVQEIAKDSQAVTATLANALQTAYMQRFPHSIMINNHLGDDFFSLNLRSVLDFADEKGTTRNQHLKVILAQSGALVLMTLYDGLPDVAFDTAIAATVREMRVLPEKTLQSVNPPFEASPFDYVLIVVSIIAAVILVRKVRRAMR